MTKFTYWEECLESSFEEHGVIVSNIQLQDIARDVQNASENIGQAFHTPENSIIKEIELLKAKLKKEQDKVICRQCNGYGYIVSYGGTFESHSECFQCHGEGRYTR